MTSFLFGLFAWTMSTVGFWANPDAMVYPVSQLMVTKSVFIGKMTCSARLVDWANVQHWCTKGGKVVRNEIQAIGYNSVAILEYQDNKLGEPTAMVSWMVAFVEGNPQTVGYQVTYSPDTSNGQPQKSLSGQF